MNLDSLEKHPVRQDLETLNRLSVQVVFDTASYPVPSGTRSSDITSRHMLFQTEKICLDLRLERHPTSSRAELVGQLADRQDPLKPISHVPVYLVAGDRLLGQTVSNRLGEFQVSYQPERDMTLCVPIQQDKLIEIPVDRRMIHRHQPS
jgi:hypothetical protein